MVSLSQRFMIPLADAKAYLDIEEDFTEDDTLIQDMIDAVIALADHSLNRDWETQEVPPYVTIACKKALKDWYDKPDGTTTGERRGNVLIYSGMPDKVAWSFQRVLWAGRKLPGA